MTPAEIEEEITVITEWGLKGVKLHPDFQKIALMIRLSTPLPVNYRGSSRF